MGTSRLCEMLISHAYASPEQDLREPTTPNGSQRCGLPRHIAPSSGDPTLPERDDQQYSASPHGHAYSGGLLRELSLTAERYRLAECLREANHLVHGRTDDGDDFPWLFPSPWQSKHASDDSVNSPAAYVTSAVQLDCSSGYDRVVENYSDGVRCILDDLTSSEGSCYDYARGDNVGSFEHYWRREAEIQATYGAYRSEYVASSESLRQDVDAVVEKASQEQPTDCELQPTDCELQPTDCELQPTDCEQQLTDSEQRSTDCELSPCSSQESSDVGVAITTDGAANATASLEASNGREEEARATQATSSGVGSGEKRKRSTPRKSINKLDPEFRGVTLHIRTTLRNNESRVTIETYFTR
ncbi:PREDICTED: uncharacterized protein LOC106809555 [Priapulus caudatus]|uniref:Uncharacterized protein LOC106809555 n=1 Tax=Priapulus caudatus TaxID=37621 RepID=A0ABM1E7J2_PRICU|nr:PREDICTED: uncharacterized protein LOC106809555 [Priapulus caudatus]